MNRVALSILLLLLGAGAPSFAQVEPALDSPRPIAAGSSLWAEELTWMETRDLIQAGTTTIIIGTGGMEQNGPYVVAGKHNYVLATVLPYIARSIGNALIAPIVKFVPEGDFDPEPTSHLKFPGTISVEPATFDALLRDICRSYRAQGFVDIVLLGDSGGNQAGMEQVANSLNETWKAEQTRVHYLREYYTEDQWSYQYLKSLGITQIDKSPPAGESADRPSAWRNGIHDDLYYEAQIAVQDPEFIRMNQRIEAGLFTLHGVELSPIENTIELGNKLAAYRAAITARAFEASRQRLRPSQGAKEAK